MFIINSFGARGTFSEMTTSCVARKEVSKIWSSKHVKSSLTKLKMVREKGKRKAVSPKGAIPKDIRQEMDDDDGIEWEDVVQGNKVTKCPVHRLL